MWIHGTDRQLSEMGVGEGTRWKKLEGLAKGHTCVTCRHGQQCGEGQREGGQGLVEGGRGGGRMRTPVIV